MANKDLDFDEIDMAVNDHMSLSDAHEISKEKDAKDSDSDDRFELSNSDDNKKSVVPKNSQEGVDTVSHLIHSTSAPMTKPPVPHPQVGRFMDVMHPSSMMKKQAPVPKRKKNKIEAESDPDHLLEPGDLPPLLTPFLPDANEKVEKRPLGWSPSQPEDQSASNVTNEAPSTHDEEASEKHDSLHPDDTENSASHENLLTSAKEHSEPTEQSESDPQLQTDPTERPVEEETEEMKLLKIESQEVSESSTYDSGSNTTTSGENHQSGVSEGEVGNTQQNTIYDVNEYHQPLQHPAKQKSGWLTVFIIVIIIALSAGLAAGAYFFFGSNL